MKKIIFAFFFVFVATPFIAQTVSSSCSSNDSIKHLYMDDADRIILKRIYQQNLTYIDSVAIPQIYSDTILKALVAVYNATALPARNKVVSVYKIHTFPNPIMNGLYLAADSNLIWMHQLKAGNILTGNAQVDNLTSKYGLTLQNYSDFGGFFSYHLVALTSDSNYNMGPLTDLFETIPGVTYSEGESTVGDGNNITASIFPGYVGLSYSIGWEDCPSGCISRHFWNFKVNSNCSVEYLGESGFPIPVPATPTIVVAGSKCTNQTLTVTISSSSYNTLNNQTMGTNQFTLSSTTPTSYVISATNLDYPGYTTSSQSLSLVNCYVSTTSIREYNNSNIASIFPNPVKEILFVDLKTKNISHVKINDIVGKTLIEIDAGEFPLQIDVNKLSKGIYFLKLENETKKFVKD